MEIHNNGTNNQVLGTAHIYKVKRNRKLASGEIKQYETTVKYQPKTDRVVIDEDLKQKILFDVNYGLKKATIAKKYNITTYRVNNIINAMN
jgi:Mor family transcriptional regulator